MLAKITQTSTSGRLEMVCAPETHFTIPTKHHGICNPLPQTDYVCFINFPHRFEHLGKDYHTSI